jgi:hypothetical protein
MSGASITGYGLCGCGCGQSTTIADRTRPKRGDVKGQPRKYLRGHARRRTVEDYAVDSATGCWIWLRSLLASGYGQAWDSNRGQLVSAHRLYYERFVGPIPDGLQIDHVWERGCRSKTCVNPEHLEPVTCGENNRRARETAGHPQGVKTHCVQGHAFDVANTHIRPDGSRSCRACDREHARAYRARRQVAPAPDAPEGADPRQDHTGFSDGLL